MLKYKIIISIISFSFALILNRFTAYDVNTFLGLIPYTILLVTITILIINGFLVFYEETKQDLIECLILAFPFINLIYAYRYFKQEVFNKDKENK